ncbi:CARDB domain-containing protein [Aquimarina sp. 2201CG1-2-11]|uniref:CARDB domain-containing protein n=1 Tax=Aquimarina discodermiae TaxID=3231043 RepID=UPI003462E291
MKKQFILMAFIVMSSPFLFAQDIDVTISTSQVSSVVQAREYALLSWSVKSRNNTAAPESKIKFYLSKDSESSRDDLFLGTAAVPELVEGNEGPVQYLWVQIPSDVSAGNYYILFHVDADNEIAEASESDNVKAEAIEVLVTAKSDLVVSSTDLPLTGIEGNQVKIGWAIQNQGNAPAVQTYLTVYLSETPEITDNAVKVLGVNVDPIYEGERVTNDAIITIPSDSRIDGGVIGKRYLVFEVDSNEQERESNESNNTDFKRINISGNSDLVSTAIVAYGSIDYYAPHVKGVVYDVEFQVTNQGSAATGKTSTVKCYLSRDNKLDANDELIRTISNIPALDANESHSIRFFNRWDRYFPGPGGSIDLQHKLNELLRHKLIIVLDTENVIAESNEDNNAVAQGLIIKPSHVIPGTAEEPETTVAFPIPVRDVLNVTVIDNTQITIHSTSNGASVLTKEFPLAGTYQLDVSSLRTGGYVLQDNRGKKINFVKE